MSLLIFSSINTNAKSSLNIDPSLNEYIESIIKIFPSEFEECTWNQSSKINNVTMLYDLDNNINGYIFEITTNNIDTGFIQIDCSTGENIVSSFSFTGNHQLNSMLTEFKKQNIESKSEEVDKIYYLGNYNYLINNPSKNNKYYNLNSQNEVTDTDETLKNKYKKHVKDKSNTSNNTLSSPEVSTMSLNTASSTTSSAITKYVTNANYNMLVSMGDFKGKYIGSTKVDRHCSPTAGTNIIKYWALQRGVTNLYYQSDWWVFSSLFVNMKTNPLVGTTLQDTYNGLWNYGANTRGVRPTGSDLITDVSYSKAKNLVQANVPFIIGVENYDGVAGGHAISCFGYYENSTLFNSSKYVIVNNSWDKNWTFEYYNNLNVLCFLYSKWS